MNDTALDEIDDVDRHNLGVLVVHGIGEQRQGEHLREFCEAIVGWLTCWGGYISNPNRESSFSPTLTVDIEKATWGRSDEPAHAVLRIRGPTGDEVTWLIAEGWWAAAVLPTPFLPVALWIALLGPFLVLDQFLNVLVRKWHQLPRARLAPWAGLASASLGVLLAPFIGAGIVASIVGLLVVRILPIPYIHRTAKRLAFSISASLGDSYVFSSSRVTSAVITNSVQSAADWVSSQSRSMAVVAHSQGAAVAHTVLRDKRPLNLSLFATFGSGLRRLKELAILRSGAIRLFLIGFVSLFGLVVLTVAGTRAIVSTVLRVQAELWPQRLAVTGLVAVVIAVWAARRLRTNLNLRFMSADLASLSWVDYFASADLVPDGPMSRGPTESCEVSNFGSYIRDHSSYLKNVDQFLADLTVRLGKATIPRIDLDRLSARSGEFRRAAAQHRKSRVDTLTSLRLVLGFAVIIALMFASDVRTRWGTSIVELAISNVPDLTWLASTKSWLRELDPRTAGGLATLVATSATFFGVTVIWSIWNRLYVRRFFAPVLDLPRSLRRMSLPTEKHTPAKWPPGSGRVAIALAALLLTSLGAATGSLQDWLFFLGLGGSFVSLLTGLKTTWAGLKNHVRGRVIVGLILIAVAIASGFILALFGDISIEVG